MEKCPGVVEEEQAVLVSYSTMVGWISSGVCGLEPAATKRMSIILDVVGDSRGMVGPAGAPVQTIALSAQQHKPVDLRRQDAGVAQVGRERQVEGHAIKGDTIVAAVHPVHEGKEGNAAHKKGEQDHAAIGLVQPAVLQIELDKYLPQGDKGCAQLR